MEGRLPSISNPKQCHTVYPQLYPPRYVTVCAVRKCQVVCKLFTQYLLCAVLTGYSLKLFLMLYGSEDCYISCYISCIFNWATILY